MKVRIKFTKTGDLKFIGHLDVMRYFQKLFRRAQIPIAYTEGFSPHQILAFTPPLPLGATSIGEYADIELTESISSDDAILRLNENSVEDIRILSFKEIDDKALNAMACVEAARYEVSLRNEDDYPFDIKTDLKEILNKDCIEVEKETKKGTKIVDINPFIYNVKPIDNVKSGIDITLSAGSTDNIKPELIYKAIFEKHNISLGKRACNIKRIDMFTKIDDKFVSLDDIGRIIK